jgi:hypothetical protein
MDTTATATAKDHRILHAIAKHRASFQAAVARSALWRLILTSGDEPPSPTIAVRNAAIDRVLGRDAAAAGA